ncbi:hypothetical protein [Acidovorax sp. ACV01]|uniref:hypothetical protein n=1 Tax=Acidovorax sp. ACV01 TaxID=2769311 RepID=UPI0017849248|nr:hypothetical protein [Acidovorax sp. ACV01]
MKASQSLFVILKNNDVELGYLSQAGGSNTWTSIAQSAIPVSGDRQGLSDLDDALEKMLFQDEGANKRWSDIHVIASERWLQSLSVPWSQALLRIETEQAFLRDQFLASGVMLASADVLQIGDGPEGQPRLAVLYPDQLIQTLRKWSSQLGGALISVQPLYLAGWALLRQSATRKLSRENSSRPPWRMLALSDKDSVTLVYGPIGVSAEHGIIEGISHRYADLVSDELGGVQMAWRRFALRNPHFKALEEIPVFNVSSGSLAFVSQDDTQRPGSALLKMGIGDLVQAASVMTGHPLRLENTAPGWKSWHWLILLTLLLTVFFLAIRIGFSASEHRNLASKISEIQRITSSLQVVKKWSKEEVNKFQSINRAVRDLNVPVDALLEALIPPKDIKVAVLGMETVGKTLSASSKTSSIKLTGQACSTADMARYVAFVSDRKPFTGASLLRHEFSEKLGRCPYKFTVEAKWSD